MFVIGLSVQRQSPWEANWRFCFLWQHFSKSSCCLFVCFFSNTLFCVSYWDKFISLHIIFFPWVGVFAAVFAFIISSGKKQAKVREHNSEMEKSCNTWVCLYLDKDTRLTSPKNRRYSELINLWLKSVHLPRENGRCEVGLTQTFDFWVEQLSLEQRFLLNQTSHVHSVTVTGAHSAPGCFEDMLMLKETVHPKFTPI